MATLLNAMFLSAGIMYLGSIYLAMTRSNPPWAPMRDWRLTAFMHTDLYRWAGLGLGLSSLFLGLVSAMGHGTGMHMEALTPALLVAATLLVSVALGAFVLTVLSRRSSTPKTKSF